MADLGQQEAIGTWASEWASVDLGPCRGPANPQPFATEGAVKRPDEGARNQRGQQGRQDNQHQHQHQQGHRDTIYTISTS
jgi:hypothetical protein